MKTYKPSVTQSVPWNTLTTEELEQEYDRLNKRYQSYYQRHQEAPDEQHKRFWKALGRLAWEAGEHCAVEWTKREKPKEAA